MLQTSHRKGMAQIKELLNAVLHDLNDFKALNIHSLDVHLITQITDFMVIATGTSSRHVCAIADNLVRKMKTRHVQILTIEGDTDNEWVLVDLGDVIVHIMQERTRHFYQLEKLWSTSPSYELSLAMA